MIVTVKTRYTLYTDTVIHNMSLYLLLQEEVRKYITDKVEIVFAALKSETEMKHSDSRVLGAKDS